MFNYFGSQWENMIMQPILVKLRFTANIGKAIVNTIWHPSQKTALFSDGSGIMTLKVRGIRYFHDWVMGWGDRMEVLEPDTLRNEVLQLASSLVSMYNHKK